LPFPPKKKKNTNLFIINLPKIVTIAYNIKDFLLSYFEYCQIWLNIIMDDCHLSNTTKLNEFFFKIKNTCPFIFIWCVISSVVRLFEFSMNCRFLSISEPENRRFFERKYIIIHILRSLRIQTSTNTHLLDLLLPIGCEKISFVVHGYLNFQRTVNFSFF
jgi:hypothetical protein